MAFALATKLIHDDDFARAGNHHQLTLAVAHIAHGGVEAHATVGFGFNIAGDGCARSRTPDVEGTHGQLRAGLTDGLRGNHAHGLAHIDQTAAAQIAAIALGTQAVAGFAGQRRAHFHFVHTGRFKQVDHVFGEHFARLGHHFAGFGVQHIFGRAAAQNPLAQAFQHLAALHNGAHVLAVVGAAIVFLDNQILRHIDQTTGQVARVGGFQRRIGQTFTRTVGRNEVLQYVQTLAEVGGNRRLDNGAVRLGHQPPHTGELANLRRRAARARVGHHVDGVERFLIFFLAVAVHDFFFGQLCHHDFGNIVRSLAPDIHHLVVALARSDQTRRVLLLDLFHFGFGAIDDVELLRRHQHVFNRDGNAGACRQTEAVLQQLVGKHHGFFQAAFAETAVDQAGNFLLLQRLVQLAEGQALGQNLAQQGATCRGFHQAGGRHQFARGLVFFPFCQAHVDAAGQFHFLVGQRAFNFLDVSKHHAFTLAIDFFAGGVVQAQHHVLRRHDGRFARGGEQHVVGCQHQHARFQLRLDRQGHVHGHLVTVKVGVEGRAHQRVQLNGFAFDQDRLERLDTQTVQRWRTVQQHRVLFDDLFQNVPHDGVVVFHLFLGGLDRGGNAHLLQAGKDEGFEQLQRHQLGQTALVQFERRAYGNHRAAGIIHALAQQVLTEATAFALDHVGQRLERTLVGARHGLAAAAVVQQAIHRFLQHALLIARNDFGRFQLQQATQTAVAVDHTAIQIVQIARGKTTAIQRHQRTQIRWQHRQHFHDHPLRLDAGFLERFEHFQALGVFLDLGFGTGQVAAQALDLRLDIEAIQQLLDAFCAHLGNKLVAVFDHVLVVLVLAHDAEFFQRRHARVGHDIGFKVQHALDVAQRHIQHQAQARRQGLEEPDVGARRSQVDVAHALAAHLGLRHFHAAFFADHAAMLEAFVLAAQALVVFDRAKNLGTEQTVTLGLEGPIVDGFGFFDFAIRPGTDFLWRGQADFDGIEMLIGLDLFEQVEQRFHGLLSLITNRYEGNGTDMVCSISRVPARYQCPANGFP